VINYNHLYYFHVCAEESAIGRAAERLGITQPTVSEQLRRLEESLGAKLFERTPSGLRLTDAGRRAYEHTSAMFRASERLLDSFSTKSDSFASLAVGVGSAVSRTVAADFLFPLLAVEHWIPSISTGETTELLRTLQAKELDLVLTESEPTEPARRGLRMVTLLAAPLIAIAPPSVEPTADWHDLGLIHYRRGSTYRWEVDAYLDERGLRPRPACETDDGVFMVESVARGAFVAFVPQGLARDALAVGRVREIARLDRRSAAIHALYHDVESALPARQAVEVLARHAQQTADG
jgi:DNA-binding transcriptional LysR family regulator